MSRTIIHLFVLLLLVSTGACTTETSTSPLPPTAPRDTVRLSADTVAAGDTAVLELVLVNPDSAIASLAFALQWASSGIAFDTVDTIRPRFPAAGMEWTVGRFDAINSMTFLMVDFQNQVSVSPGSGPLLRLRYAVDAAVVPGVYSVDTSSAAGASPLDISYPSGLTVPPVAFVPGRIVVQ